MPFSLITTLVDILFPLHQTAARIRTLTEHKVTKFYDPKEIEHGHALMPFKKRTVRDLIHALKYQKDTHARYLLLRIIENYLSELAEDTYLFSPDRKIVLIPMPISKESMRERGFNQITFLFEKLELPENMEVNSNILKRVKNTKRQTKLPRKERLMNVAGSMEAKITEPKHLYIVVDDVTTTGSTLKETTRALTLAGACDVKTLAIAYA